MTRRIKNICYLIATLLLGGILNSAAQDADAILGKMDYIVNAPKDKEGTVKIILIDKTGKEKVREAEMLQKGPHKKLYRYTKPDSQAGIATLTLPDNIMWLYLPALGKPKKISMLTKDSSFNNTDFSYEDMATTPYADRFTPELIESSGDFYVLNLLSKSGKSNYSKIIAKISKEHGYVETMDIYDLKGKKFKEATYKYEKVGKYWNASEVVMKDLEKNHSTKILVSDVKFDSGLSDDIFLVENLKPLAKKKVN
ncbi:MAG TPA: outer membrane lipoprotein-sorting protein [Bacteroidales bacterium]|nr:outer membrane lipoprotein-sorting protein [Bacteroidales bacterium]